ncbi:MAG TPA: hypothetical protein VEB64_15595 [Azospirillaceae bacterium]|nr:hypothetical protein [Azospirillaceae bacterium]
MDKLEKALRKAREQREARLAGESGNGAPLPAPETNAPAPADKLPPDAPAERSTAASRAKDGQPIIYNQTRVVRPSAEVLREMRVIAVERSGLSADAFRILRTKLLQLLARGGQRTLAITSANPGEGKTLIAVNLALSIALDVKQTVLLVDLDLRTPSVHHYLGLKPEKGLGDHLLHDVPLAECLIHPGFDRLVVLPVGRPLDSSSEMLAAPRMQSLSQELRNRYPNRIVIYDTRALFTSDDTMAFLPNIEASLLVIKEGATQAEDVRRAIGLLADNTTVLGTVLNQSSDRSFVRT